MSPFQTSGCRFIRHSAGRLLLLSANSLLLIFNIEISINKTLLTLQRGHKTPEIFISDDKDMEHPVVSTIKGRDSTQNVRYLSCLLGYLQRIGRIFMQVYYHALLEYLRVQVQEQM